MRREFGTSIDVQKFLYDLSYAQEVLDLATSSQNEKLKEGAEYLKRAVLNPGESGIPATKRRSTAEVQSKDSLDIDMVAVENPGFIISNVNESTEVAKLAPGLMSKYAAAAR
jgi:hypothetical protein